MGLEWLTYLRVFVPGLFIMLAGASILAPDANPVERFKDLELEVKGIWTFSIVLAGLLYHVFGLRQRIGGLDWADVHANIKRHLLAVSGVPADGAQTAYLLDGRRLLDVFYLLVDGNPSQVVRQTRVRFNGLLVSSSCDLAAVAVMAGGSHFLLACWLWDMRHLLWFLSLTVLFLVCRRLLEPRLMAKHLELSNEQIGFIADFQRPQLDDAIRAALARGP